MKFTGPYNTVSRREQHHLGVVIPGMVAVTDPRTGEASATTAGLAACKVARVVVCVPAEQLKLACDVVKKLMANILS